MLQYELIRREFVFLANAGNIQPNGHGLIYTYLLHQALIS